MSNDVYTIWQMVELVRRTWAKVYHPRQQVVVVKPMGAVHDFYDTFSYERGVTKHFYGLQSKSSQTASEVKRCLHNFLFEKEDGHVVVYAREWTSEERADHEWMGDSQGRGWRLFKSTADLTSVTCRAIPRQLIPNFGAYHTKMVNVLPSWKKSILILGADRAITEAGKRR